MSLKEKRPRGGRPRKFGEPSRPVTITLPERVLRLLAAVDSDRAKAVTRLVDAALSGQEGPRKPVELVAVGAGMSVILVAHSAYLTRIPWLHLVEVAPARHLISVLPGTPIEKLEIAISDLLDTLPSDQQNERELLEMLRFSIRAPRRNQTLIKEEILFVRSIPS